MIYNMRRRENIADKLRQYNRIKTVIFNLNLKLIKTPNYKYPIKVVNI